MGLTLTRPTTPGSLLTTHASDVAPADFPNPAYYMMLLMHSHPEFAGYMLMDVSPLEDGAAALFAALHPDTSRAEDPNCITSNTCKYYPGFRWYLASDIAAAHNKLYEGQQFSRASIVNAFAKVRHSNGSRAS
jgi:hypothetical protein